MRTCAACCQTGGRRAPAPRRGRGSSAALCLCMGAFERRWDDDDSTQGRGARVSPLAEGGATHRAVTTYCSHTPLSPRFWLWSDLNDLCQRGACDVGRNLASPLQRATTFRCVYYPACALWFGVWSVAARFLFQKLAFQNLGKYVSHCTCTGATDDGHRRTVLVPLTMSGQAAALRLRPSPRCGSG